MTAPERLSEVAALLGAAYLRLLSRRNSLEALPQAEALCALNGQETPGKETAWKKG
jgi:hypothetical protein